MAFKNFYKQQETNEKISEHPFKSGSDYARTDDVYEGGQQMISKFRAWDKEKDRMIYPSTLGVCFELDDDGINVVDVDVDYPIDHIFPRIDSELMQSTGLKDKNGVEIFEGDVVVVENHPFQRKEDSSAGMEIEGDYVVGWNQHDLTWCAGDLLLARLKPYVRVIGNIYDNPDLLEAE